MASNNDGSHSPMPYGIPSHFSSEDIQELLGAMGDGTEHLHLQRRGSELSSNDEMVSSAASFAPPASSLHYERSGGTSVSTSSIKVFDSSCAGDLPGEEIKAQARSERKRSREKQRRSDVNKQFADLTQLLQRIDAEDVHDEDAKHGTSAASRVTFNPSNRVDLIARTIVLLERLHDANKRRKTEMQSLQQQLEEAKKAGEETAAKLKEALLAPPCQPSHRQIMMMVPMMMSADGTGATQPLPMMNPYIPQASMAQAYCPVPTHPMAAPVAEATAAAAGASAQAPAQAPAAPPAAAAIPTPGRQQEVGNIMVVAQGQPTQAPPPGQYHQAYSYMMPPPMAGGGYMMPVPAHHMNVPQGQPMAMMAQPHSMQMALQQQHHHHQHHQQQQQQQQQQESQNGRQEQKDSSPVLNGGSGNLAHCA